MSTAPPPGREATADVTVRPLEPRDLERVAAIYNQVVRDTAATLDTEEKSLEELAAWLRHHDERYPAIAAVRGQEFLGYATLSPFAARGGYRISAELSIYLDPAHTGRGVGATLATTLIEHARAAGFSTLLSLTTSTNVAPQRLVERLGFTYTGRLRCIGYKHGQLVDLVCHQLFFEDTIARCGGAPADVESERRSPWAAPRTPSR